MSKYCFSCRNIVTNDSAASCPFCGAPFGFSTGSTPVVPVAPVSQPQPQVQPQYQPQYQQPVNPQIQYTNPTVSSQTSVQCQPQSGGIKCPNCGANIGRGTVCQYCGSQISYEMKREQEQLNKQGCPKCGSSNIQFKRENHGETRDKTSKTVIHRTVGLCKDCGFTWYVEEPQQKKRKTWLWVLGWIFIFPLPLTILLLRKKEMNPILKYGIIAVAWIFFLIIAFAGRSGNTDQKPVKETVSEQNKDTESKKGSSKDTDSSLYEDATIMDMMSGSGKNKIGTLTICHANSSDCTEDALSDWYNNYVIKHKDSNVHFIVYDDVPGKGVYSTGAGFIEKDIALNKKTDGTYEIGNDAGVTMYTVTDDGSLKQGIVMADEKSIEQIKTAVEDVIPDKYKNSDIYMVDIAGESGGLMDCNITLVSKEFNDTNCQSIAETLAAKIKNLSLNIGYFCIAFQQDDYSILALSSVDDLSTQDSSEVTTRYFEKINKTNDTEPSSYTDLSEENAIELYTSALESAMKDTLSGECSVQVDKESKIVSLMVSADGVVLDALRLKLQSDETPADWINMRQSMEYACKNWHDVMPSYGLEGWHLAMYLLNDVNKDNTLLAILDGVTFADAMEQ